jgi:hypothetical protein
MDSGRGLKSGGDAVSASPRSCNETTPSKRTGRVRKVKSLPRIRYVRQTPRLFVFLGLILSFLFASCFFGLAGLATPPKSTSARLAFVFNSCAMLAAGLAGPKPGLSVDRLPMPDLCATPSAGDHGLVDPACGRATDGRLCAACLRGAAVDAATARQHAAPPRRVDCDRGETHASRVADDGLNQCGAAPTPTPKASCNPILQLDSPRRGFACAAHSAASIVPPGVAIRGRAPAAEAECRRRLVPQQPAR